MENLKYKILEDNYILYLGKKLYRIQALKDFSNVKKGDIGGYIESYDNLSQHGNSWIYNDAKVYGNARVYENACVYESAQISGNAEVFENAKVFRSARVSGNAEVFENAKIFGSAEVYGSAQISGNAEVFENAKVFRSARVSGNAEVFENAKIFGSAEVYGSAQISGSAEVFENAKVYGSAEVFEDAQIYESAYVYGNTRVYGNAEVRENQYIQNGVVKTDLTKDIKENIRCQTGLGVFNNKVIAYKQVGKDLTSFYDDKFKYEVGKVVEVENPDMSKESCASGLHFSNMNYWNKNKDILNSTFLMAEIDIKDVITVQEGKIRCKKAKILGAYNIKE